MNNKENDWDKHSMLVLNELKRLNEGQQKISLEMDDRFKEINSTLSEFKVTIKDVKDLKDWKEKVNDVWSPPQMKESKNEVYKQKDKWSRVIGFLIVVELVIGFVITFVLKKL